MAESTTARDINTISAFLTNPQISDLTTFAQTQQIDVIVSCVSSVLFPTTNLFKILEQNPKLTKTLVLCGGIGHSTSHIYDAVAAHPVYQTIHDEIIGLPESRVLSKILEKFFGGEKMREAGLNILVEERSTNCGANTVECKKVLDQADIHPETIVLYQDCTMSLRTKAGFDKVYEGLGVEVLCWTGWLPWVKENTNGGVEFDLERIGKETGTLIRVQDLWNIQRFLDLVMGEIPRFERYGPEGLGSIVGVQIPAQVMEAWKRLEKAGLGNR